MKYILNIITLLSVTFATCQNSNFKKEGDIDKDFKEVSAVEIVGNSKLLWVIEDGGNGAKLLALSKSGKTEKEVDITNAKNQDWEDLTSDKKGNLYIGDFGNNSKKRKEFSILKITDVNTLVEETEAVEIKFTLPKKMKSEDFEAFFLFNNYFYIFSKERKKAIFIKVPNKLGEHEAEIVSKYYLKGKHTKVTSADISEDGKTIALLNHDKVWLLKDFEGDHFFSGIVKAIDLEHDSQKEGICFKDDFNLYITDEREKSKNGTIYSLKL